MKPVIKVDKLSKKYRYGERKPYITLRDTIAEFYKNPLGKIKERELEKDEFWALKDVSFKVNKGEVLGVIGPNGSGKSTLLKILSRITPPTYGKAVLRGRVASLLEVGTGFNPELTGRENIYLNGSILGMRRKEIKKKFDDIVEFSGVGKFLDTPVKRYSSGMYVRLAFSVSSILDAEVLIIDEVLSVGDEDFQKKSLNKMDAAARGGRTVIFVSHNLQAVKSLCNNAILLKNGEIKFSGNVNEVVEKYLDLDQNKEKRGSVFNQNKDAEIYVKNLTIQSENETNSSILLFEPFVLEVKVESKIDIKNVIVGFDIHKSRNEYITTFHSLELGYNLTKKRRNLTNIHKGTNIFRIEIQNNIFRPGKYYLGYSIFSRELKKTFDKTPNCLTFNIEKYNHLDLFDTRQQGIVILDNIKWIRKK